MSAATARGTPAFVSCSAVPAVDVAPIIPLSQTRTLPFGDKDTNTTNNNSLSAAVTTDLKSKIQSVPVASNSVIQATGVASTAFAGALSPTVANKANNLGRILQAASCNLEDDEEDIIDPPWHQFLLPIAVRVGAGTSVPSSKGKVGGFFDKAVGALLSTNALILAALALCLAVTAWSDGRKSMKLRKYSSLFMAVLLSFYGPNIASLATTVLLHSEAPIEKVIGGVSLLIPLVLLTVCGTVVLRMSKDTSGRVHRYLMSSPASGTESRSLPPSCHNHDKSNTAEGTSEEGPQSSSSNNNRLISDFPWAMAPLIESARTPIVTLVRLHVIEDMTAAMLLAMVSGIRPVTGSCIIIAAAQFAVAVAHFLYVASLRPFLCQFEQLFSVLIGAAQGVLSGIILAVVLSSSRDDLRDPSTEPPLSLVIAAWLGFALNITFFVQMGALTIVEMLRMKGTLTARWELAHDPKTRGTKDDDEDAAMNLPAGDGDGIDASVAPLLTVAVPLSGTVTPDRKAGTMSSTNRSNSSATGEVASKTHNPLAKQQN